ncbi:hypothetical protein REPUB_Repub17cG0137000 [Reevesia pubescens]
MASASSTALSIPSSSTLADAKALRRTTAASPPCVTLPILPPPPVQSQSRPWKTTAYCRKIARNVMAMATGEVPAEVATTELPEFVKTVQEVWEKVEDKYAVSSLAVAGVIALWGSTGMILWFAYKNLIFRPDRENLVQKIKDTYKEIIGSS